LRDLKYVIETPDTVICLLLPGRYSVHSALSTNSRDAELLAFGTVWARLLRIAQGMDPQKRKVSGGLVEYEWLEAFSLSLNFAGTRDALAERAESLTNCSSAAIAHVTADGSHLSYIHQAMGNLFVAIGVGDWPTDPSSMRSSAALMCSSWKLCSEARFTYRQVPGAGSGQHAVVLACATGVNMTEAQLEIIDSALRIERDQ